MLPVPKWIHFFINVNRAKLDPFLFKNTKWIHLRYTNQKHYNSNCFSSVRINSRQIATSEPPRCPRNSPVNPLTSSSTISKYFLKIAGVLHVDMFYWNRLSYSLILTCFSSVALEQRPFFEDRGCSPPFLFFELLHVLIWICFSVPDKPWGLWSACSNLEPRSRTTTLWLGRAPFISSACVP